MVAADDYAGLPDYVAWILLPWKLSISDYDSFHVSKDKVFRGKMRNFAKSKSYSAHDQ